MSRLDYRGDYRGDRRDFRGDRGERNDRDEGATRLYVGRLSTRTRTRDLEDLFAKYGRIRDVDVKHDFAFVEFTDARDADDARHYVNGKDFDGNRLIVEFARKGPRGPGGAREYLGRGPPPGTGRCYNCGNDGHWARDCKAGDWRNKCYRCGQRGHIERNCRNSPKPTSSPSRSRSRSPRGHSRSHKCLSRSRSQSYSRSPARRGSYSPVKEELWKRSTQSKSRSLTHSPLLKAERNRSGSILGNGTSPSHSPVCASRSLSPLDDSQSSPIRDVNLNDSPGVYIYEESPVKKQISPFEDGSPSPSED